MIWLFPNSWGTPSYHPFLDGFSLINHPAIGAPPPYSFQNLIFRVYFSSEIKEDLYMEIPHMIALDDPWVFAIVLDEFH